MEDSELVNKLWLSWNEINQRGKGKRIIFFGRGTWMGKTLNYLTNDGDYAVDNSKYEQGEIEKGLKIYHPDKLKEETWDDIFIIITTSAFYEVTTQLQNYGLIPGKHFCITPSLKDFNSISKVTSHDQTLYIACSDSYLEGNLERGGGFYKYNTSSGELKKIINGLCHSIVDGKGCKYLIDDMVGIRILDEKFSTIDIIELPQKTRPHGIAFCPTRELIFISFTGHDSIGIYDANNHRKVEEISLSKKFEKLGIAQHHINDLCVIDDSLYVSMFSISGNWRLGLYDGGIIEFDIDSLEFKNPVLRDRWMPHNPMIIGENFFYCDSMRGTVNCGTWKTIIKLNGFVRGLAYDNEFFFVGHSMHRHIHRVEGSSHNISIDTGIYMVDETSKVTKFFPIPQLSDIHALYIPSA